MNASPCELDPSSLALLHDYGWPGNVRELENIVTRACVLHAGRIVTADALRPWLSAAGGQVYAAIRTETGSSEAKDSVRLGEMERQLIEATLNRYGGHRERTAKALGIGVRTLSNKLRAWGYAPRTKEFARAA